MLFRWQLVVFFLAASLLNAGCASLRRSSTPESLDTCRQLSRQGISAMEVGKWNEAELLLRRAADAAPTDATARVHLAEALWQRGDHAGAIQQMDKARELDTLDGAIAARAGEMHLAVNNISAAAERANKAVSLSPETPEAWLLRARVSARQARQGDALADLHRALSLAPNNTEAIAELAAYHHQQRDHQRCLTAVHQWIDCFPPGQEPQMALVMEGQTFLALQRPFEARDSLLLATTRGPVSAPLLYSQAEVELACGQPGEAVRLAQQAVGMDSSHGPARQMLAQLSTPTLQR
jgi:Flp pilus assembly protein TadD